MFHLLRDGPRDGMGSTLWIPYLTMPVGFGLFALQLTSDLFEVLLTPAEKIVVAARTDGSFGARTVSCDRDDIDFVFRNLRRERAFGGLGDLFADLRWFPVIGVNSRGIVWEA